jgi:hypothetical protein
MGAGSGSGGSSGMDGSGGGVANPMGGGSGGMGTSGAGGSSSMDAGGMTGGNAFDAGTAADRNAVTPGKICDRLAAILCAGEAACCTNPGRDFSTCNMAVNKSCSADFMFDAVAGQAAAAFDADQAKTVFTQLEHLASTCDVSIASYIESSDGLRKIFKGTKASGADCTPTNGLDKAMAGGALASCMMNDSYACLPAVAPLPWMCVMRAGSGSRCFSDVNCSAGLYCDNPDLTVNLTSKCMTRKAVGASCKTTNECETLLCKAGKCVDKNQQNAYCPLD